ncbi:BPSL0761 family protein [Pseudoxanthomonas mexicana]
MTTPEEKTRALVWAGGFLIELARNASLPLAVRRQAVVIARHFPTIEEVSAMAQFRHPTGLGMGLDIPDEREHAGESLSGRPRYGPLRYSTRLAWPEG